MRARERERPFLQIIIQNKGLWKETRFCETFICHANSRVKGQVRPFNGECPHDSEMLCVCLCFRNTEDRKCLRTVFAATCLPWLPWQQFRHGNRVLESSKAQRVNRTIRRCDGGVGKGGCRGTVYVAEFCLCFCIRGVVLLQQDE